MPPKKPSLQSIFKTPKKSPAGSIDIPLPTELPTVTGLEETIREIITTKPSSPTPPINIQAKIENKKSGYLDTIKNKGCKFLGKYLTSRDGTDSVLYYVKCIDKQGTPFYIGMGSYGGDAPAPNETFEGAMIRFPNAPVESNIKYIIASNRKTDHIIECPDNKFCVVKNTDDGSYNVDIFVIPKDDDLRSMVEEEKNTQTSKPEGSQEIEKTAILSYKVFDYEVFVAADPAYIYKENMDFYNSQLRNAYDTFRGKMKKVDDSLNDLGEIINYFKINNAKAIEKTEELKKKTMKISANTSEEISQKADNIYKINQALEEYIKCSNEYNRQFVYMQKIFKNILDTNNRLYDVFEGLKTKIE